MTDTDAKQLIQRHANAARALEHMYTEKNIERLKAVGEELEAMLRSKPVGAQPVDYDRVVSICEAHGIGLPVDCVEMVVEIIRLAAPPAQTARALTVTAEMVEAAYGHFLSPSSDITRRAALARVLQMAAQPASGVDHE